MVAPLSSRAVQPNSPAGTSARHIGPALSETPGDPGGTALAGCHLGAPVYSGDQLDDLLVLAALACDAPAAVLSERNPDGTWSSHSYGLDTSNRLDEGWVFDLVADSNGPVEIADMMAGRLCRSPLVRPPHLMRWAYGVSLRDESGATTGAVAVLDRWLRSATKREQRTIVAAGRQLQSHVDGQSRGAQPVHADVEPDQAGETGSPTTPTTALAHLALAASANLEIRSGLMSAGPDVILGEDQRYLRSKEVALMFDVTERTVINWAISGKLASLRTPGGQLRFHRDDIGRLLVMNGKCS